MAAGDMCWLLGVTPGAEEGGGGEEEPELGRARHPVHVHAGGGRGRGELQGGGGGGGRLMTREEASTREQYTAPRVAWAGVL